MQITYTHCDMCILLRGSLLIQYALARQYTSAPGCYDVAATVESDARRRLGAVQGCFGDSWAAALVLVIRVCPKMGYPQIHWIIMTFPLKITIWRLSILVYTHPPFRTGAGYMHPLWLLLMSQSLPTKEPSSEMSHEERRGWAR